MPARSKTKANPKAIRVLFVGNSFTARNDLPGLIAGLATAGGGRLEHRLISAGGASLRRHWNAGAAAGIRAGGYDYVVLQEQSTLPLKNPQRMYESVRLFDRAIRTAGAKTALYMTWARRDAPPDAQDRVCEAYESIGRELGALVVPVGRAWQRFLKDQDASVLYDRDGSHPTPAGSYLAPCVYFSALFGTMAVGLDGIPPDLSPSLVRDILGSVALG